MKGVIIMGLIWVVCCMLLVYSCEYQLKQVKENGGLKSMVEDVWEGEGR